MIESHDYVVELTNTGVKTGIAGASADSLPDLPVASPPEFGGPEGVWSPEHMLVGAVATCLMTTFRAVAEASGLDVVDYEDRAIGHLRRGDDRMYSFETVTLRPQITISDPTKIDRAMRLIHKADTACLVSRSVAANVVVEPTITVAALHSSSTKNSAGSRRSMVPSPFAS